MSDRPHDAIAPNTPEEDAVTGSLRSLALPAPADTFLRFRRRAAVVQGTRMLFESQVVGFWVVLDAILRLLLGSRPADNVPSGKATGKHEIQSEGA